MATEIASLGLEADSTGIVEATLALKALPQAATAAERAAQRWGMATSQAGQQGEEFSRRVRKVISDLEFQRQQLARSSDAQTQYAALRRAGVTAESEAGKAILASVSALQAQQTAQRVVSSGYGMVARAIAPLLAAYSAAALASKAWQAGMKAGDLGEQAEQVNLTTDQLQAYRFAAVQNGVEVEKLDQAMIKLTATMGGAMKGGEEQIAVFNRLGVKLLDSNGELRATADVLPEVARGLLGVRSETERNALMTEIFGKSGARMVTMLQDWAKGNDALILQASQQGGILDAESIAAWDRLKDSLARASAAAEVTWAKLGAPIATTMLDRLEQVLKSIAGLMDQINSKQGFWASVLEESRSKGRIGSGPNALRLSTPAELEADRRAALEKELANPNNAGREQMIRDELEKQQRAQLLAQQAAAADSEDWARRIKLPAVTSTVGTSNPVPKGQTDAYAKIIAQAQSYIDKKNVETQAIGMNAQAAAQLAHEQELLSKATEANIPLTGAQIERLKRLAAGMAEADASFKSSKFMDDASKRARDFIADQNVQAQTFGMSAEAAARFRYEQEMLNRAANDNIVLTQQQRDEIGRLAEEMARAESRTQILRELYDLAKQTVTGFFSDFYSGLQRGESVWQSFANAAMNALNRIASKLIEMAAEKLFENAFGGSKGGGGGGWMSGLFNWVGGLFTSGTSGGDFPIGGGHDYARGGAFASGNVVPFARGAAFTNSIVSRPTLFPMARGMGLMGEAGPEAVVPLRRLRGGRLGVDASGMGGGGATVVVNIENNAPAQVTASQGQTADGQPSIDVLIVPLEGALAKRIDRGTGALNSVLTSRGLGQRARS